MFDQFLWLSIPVMMTKARFCLLPTFAHFSWREQVSETGPGFEKVEELGAAAASEKELREKSLKSAPN